MSTIMPEEKKVRDALKWVCAEQEDTGKRTETLLQEASFRFNLTPKEEGSLRHLFRKELEQEK
jgi:hypothetical protein